MASNNYITEFDETLSRSEVTADKRIFVADQTIQHSLAQYNAQKETGTQHIICYQPENLDLVRWKLNKCVRDSGIFGNNDFTPQWQRHVFVDGPHDLTQNEKDNFWTRKEKFKIYRNDNYGLTGRTEWSYSISSSGPSDSYNGRYDGQPVASVFGNPDIFPASVHNRVFTDHYTQLEGVSDFPDINNRTFGSVRPRYYDINPEYNFYIESFEDAVEDYVIDEKALPNMYAFIMARDEELRNPNQDQDIYELHITLNNKIENELIAQNVGAPALANNALQPFITSEGQYYDKYSKAFVDFQSNQTDYSNTVNRFQNVIVPASDLEFYKRNKENKLNFPMYVGYEFSTDINTELADSFMTS
jgi:hypothetical protein